MIFDASKKAYPKQPTSTIEAGERVGAAVGGRELETASSKPPTSPP